MDEFILKIELGNELMNCKADIANALKKVAGKLLDGSESGKIMDDNGNSVGSFEIK